VASPFPAGEAIQYCLLFYVMRNSHGLASMDNNGDKYLETNYTFVPVWDLAYLCLSFSAWTKVAPSCGDSPSQGE
jgi:hypothetical protein